MMDLPLSNEKETWAYNKIINMSLDEKVAQLFVLRIQSDWGKKDLDYITKIVEDYQIGGLAFFQGNITDQAKITNNLQNISKIPMFIAIDAETGLGMRLKDGIGYPKQLTLGAIQDNNLIYKMGLEIGRQLKRLGVNINYAPVADINNNPDNPIINDRSFGEEKNSVAEKSVAYMKGLQDAGIIACAKHFPGHGYADVDSHLDLPLLDLDKKHFFSTELVPFRSLVNNGVKSVMTGHLQIPAFDNRKSRPSSLSSNMVETLLRDSLNYEGLILTDALAMKGVAKYYNSGHAAVQAFMAGNDMLELPENFQKAFEAVKIAVKKGIISKTRLEKSLMRILKEKYDQGYHDYKPINLENIIEDINTPDALALKEDLYRKSITIVSNGLSFIPVLPEDFNKKIAILNIGSDVKTAFQDRLLSYFDFDTYHLPLQSGKAKSTELLTKLKNYNKIIVEIHDFKKRVNDNFGISYYNVDLLNKLNDNNQIIVTLFGTPYSLQLFERINSVVMAYENDDMAQDMAAQAILGTFDINAKLPINVSSKYKIGIGVEINNAKVLGYSNPEYVGIDGSYLNFKIDSIVNEMIDSSVAPGCQILIAKKGQIVFDKCFGSFTYKKFQQVQNDDIYDLASVTKVLSTNLAVMKLQDENQISIFNKISYYLDKGLKNSNKKNITIIDALSHHSGLVAWLPIYKLTLDTIHGVASPSKQYYRHKSDETFSVKVADSLFLRKDFVNKMWEKLIDSPVNPRGTYKYSDLGLIMTKEMIEEITGEKLNNYVYKNFYLPLGLKHTMYNPLGKIKKENIVPSEDDIYWRKQIVQGYVHDMYAGMLGGVSGHAGLFSNSRDMARIGQMMLNEGVYGNKRFLNYPTIYTFTTRFYISTRRGIGWDMKELDKNKDCNMSELASPSTYGHYGFTGTGIWIDPENELIYIFLSNRTFPDMNNNKLNNLNYRPKIQSVIYESFKKS
jgi:beta-glucosidase-like glycosyl hydrolase/CubicO group peptidase (beta-lactamase class C family)